MDDDKALDEKLAGRPLPCSAKIMGGCIALAGEMVRGIVSLYGS